MTKQRRVILEELRQYESHPTAADLYQTVRKRLPNISLGTVYRNLEILARADAIRKFAGDGSGARFDADLHRHHHIRCLDCGRIDDVTERTAIEPDDDGGNFNGWKISERRVEFVGTCPVCVSQEGQIHAPPVNENLNP